MYLTTAHERDPESGYDYRGARFYDSELARFLSLDPLAVKYASLSAYSYVAGNPVRLIDPNGKEIRVYYGVGEDDYYIYKNGEYGRYKETKEKNGGVSKQWIPMVANTEYLKEILRELQFLQKYSPSANKMIEELIETNYIVNVSNMDELHNEAVEEDGCITISPTAGLDKNKSLYSNKIIGAWPVFTFAHELHHSYQRFILKKSEAQMNGVVEHPMLDKNATERDATTFENTVIDEVSVHQETIKEDQSFKDAVFKDAFYKREFYFQTKGEYKATGPFNAEPIKPTTQSNNSKRKK